MKKDSQPANSSPRQGENYLEVLKQCNDLLLEQKRRLEEDLEKQRKLCTLLKLKVRELADANRAFGAERKIQATEIARLTAQVQKGHEKIFNTAFTAGSITRQVMELLNSRSFVWTNFLRYTDRTLLNFSIQGKVNFFRKVSSRILRNKRMQLPSALQGIDRELQLLNAALSELCHEVNLDGSGCQVPATVAPPIPEIPIAPPFEAVTQWKHIFTPGRGEAPSRTVAIATLLFYDADGRNYMHGGAERYLIELFGIIQSMGFETVVVQAGNSDWTLTHHCEYGELPVTALHSELLFNSFSEAVNQWQNANPCALMIYSPFLIASLYSAPNSLGISHGIFWDDPHYRLTQETVMFHQKAIRQAIANCHELISVDTNTVNWYRTMCHDAEVKMNCIPNFVNRREFHPPQNAEKRRKLRIVYPRRLYAARGFNLVLEVFPELFRKYEDIELELIGQIDDSARKQLKDFLGKFRGRVKHRCCPPEEMPEVYRRADIVLVPTCYSEGTSLSCLEAMASGCAVIATNVGGLPELIINRFNGLLIAPEAEALAEALTQLIEQPELRQDIAENALKTSECYDFARWRDEWRKVLERKLGKSRERRIEFVQLAAPGMTWNAMKQRPQQLFQALAQMGFESTYVSDEPMVNQSLLGDIPPQLHIQPNGFIPNLNGKYLYLYFPNIIYHRNFTYGELIRNSDCKIIFDILDDPSIHTNPETGKADPVFMNNFEMLLKNADFVITSARQLYEKYSGIRPDMKLVFNGVTLEDFRLQTIPERPADLPDDGRKIIGYYGALAQWVDFDLIEQAAKALPELHFVLIGLNVNEEEISRVTALGNVHFLGLKHYNQLAGYLRYFDVATIPFKINPVTDAASPIKLFEYCASGTPVVTTGFAEVMQYREQGVMVAESRDDYIAKLKQAAGLKDEDLEKLRKKLEALAESNTWAIRASIIADMVREKQENTEETEDVR